MQTKDNPFTTIRILTMMQLGDKMDLTMFTDKKKAFLSVILRLVVMVGITVLMYVIMSLAQSLLQAPITSHLLTFILMLMQVMGIITCTLGLLKTLYQSKDNALLLSYPAKHNEVFISKLIVYYILELLRNLTFLLPFMLAFGLCKSSTIHWTYYMNSVIFTALLPLICILISALLSLPIMFVADFLKGKTIITSIIVFALIGAFFYLIIVFLESLPANLELIAYYKAALTKFSLFLETIGKYGLYLICVRKILSVTPETIVSGLVVNYAILIGVIVGLVVLVYLLTMPLYFRIASHAVEMATVSKKTKMKEHKSTFATFIAKELKLTLRDSSMVMNNFFYLMLMPFLLFVINKIFSLQNTQNVGNKIVYIVNVCLGLIMVMVSNTSAATAISSEGNEFYLLKTAPSNTRQIASAKIIVNLIMSTVSIIVSTVCIYAMSGIALKEAFILFYIFMSVNVSHVLWSFEFDLMNPQVKEYIATGTTQNNRNANHSMALGVGLAFLCTALLGILLFMDTMKAAWIKMITILTFFMICRIYLFITKLRLYFDDIEM